MIKQVSKILFLVLLIVLFSKSSLTYTLVQQLQMPQMMDASDVTSGAKMIPEYGNIPLYFVPNKGQVNERALFWAKTSRYTLWVTKEGLIFDSVKKFRKDYSGLKNDQALCDKHRIDLIQSRSISRLVFLNARKNPEIVPLERTEQKVNYFIGNDETKWRTDIQTSKAILYKNLYRNIDLKVYGVERQIEYDFIVKPGGKVSDIQFALKDIKDAKLDNQGNLVIESEFGELGFQKPVSFQVIERDKKRVDSQFTRVGNCTYGFEVEKYDKNHVLIIDPLVLVYSSYLGGKSDEYCNSVVVDKKGAVYITGLTFSNDFPIKNSMQESSAGISDVFIVKIRPNGKQLIYSTYLGGTAMDKGNAITLDNEGYIYVTGSTHSDDFPLKNAFQEIKLGDSGTDDVFITKITPDGNALVYSTYLGGWLGEGGEGIAVDKKGAAYVTGNTASLDFPIKNPLQKKLAGWRDVFVTKIAPTGKALIYSTFLGGFGSNDEEVSGIAIDSKGAAYITGMTYSTNFPLKNPIQAYNAGWSDVFISKIHPNGRRLIYSTYLGGSSSDGGRDIAVDSKGNAYVAGGTGSDFPTKKAFQIYPGGGGDSFIAKIQPNGKKLIYSTYLGGSGSDRIQSLAIDSKNAVYVAGSTGSADFPTKNPLYSTYRGGWDDCFITKIKPNGSALIFSTYLGGSDTEYCNGIAIDSKKNIYVTGSTRSIDFPTKKPFQKDKAGSNEEINYRDGFIARLKYKK